MTDPITDAPAGLNPLKPAALVPEGGEAPSGATFAPPQCSDRIDAISAALAKAQGQIANPGKTAVNPHFKSQYADLSAGLNAIRAALSANAIAIVQTTRMEADVLMLNSMLAHSSGQWIGSQWQVCKLPAPPQVIGSALTYARRYTLFALVGIAGEGEDDDANAATSHDPVIDVDEIWSTWRLSSETLTRTSASFSRRSARRQSTR